MNRVKAAGINSISIKIRQRRLLLIGHTLRADATTPLCDRLLCTNDAPLRRGTEWRSRWEMIYLATSPDWT